MYISIRIKFLGVLSVLLLGAILAYLVLAERIFREDKQLLVFDTNRSNSERLASDLESSVHRVLDKVELVSKLVLDRYDERFAKDFFNSDPEILFFRLQSVESSRVKPVKELVDDFHIKSLGLTNQAVLGLGELKNEKEPSEITIENASLPDAVLFIARMPVKVEAAGGRRFYATVVIDGSRWMDVFENQNLSLNFAVTSDGKLLAHPQTALVTQRLDMSSHPMVKRALGENVISQQIEFEEDNRHYLGVYRKVSVGNVSVISVTDKKAALAASRLLLEKTIVLSLIIVTVVFLIGLWFADSLATPLKQLVRAADEIGMGRFDSRIVVNSKDEIGTLAVAFNRMANEIRDYSRSLEEKVQERTQELETKNVAIREQQDILLKTTKLASIGEVAGQAAHEVLNPLTGMIARMDNMGSRLRAFASGKDSSIEAYNVILRAWMEEFEKGGLERWLADIKRESRLKPGKLLIEEDLENLSLLSKQLAEFGKTMETDVQLLLKESFRISRIIEGMLNLSRVHKTKHRVDLAQLIRECVHASEDLLWRHRITITSHVDQKLPVEVNTDEMRQVFSNLIKNAMDAINTAAKKGRGEVGLIEIRATQENSVIHIKIRDNGTGIPPENRNRVFEAHFSTKGDAGMGLGLAICRRFVRAAGGELLVCDSVLGKFTEFEMTLPVAAEEEGEVGYATS